MLHRAVGIALLANILPLSAAAGDFERTLVADPGGTLRLHLDAGNVTVESHEEPQIRLQARSSGWSSMEFDVETRGSEVVVRGRREGLFGGLSATDARVHLRVPARFSLDIETNGGAVEIEEIFGRVAARTSGGSMSLDGIRGAVDVRTSGGSIDADQIQGDLTAQTSGGTIRISEASGRVEARTSGGSIEVLDVAGPVQVYTSGGPIAARFTGRPEGTIRTSGGSIEIEIPEGLGFELDARTSGGQVQIEPLFRMEGRIGPDEVHAAINGGGARLEVRTSGGDIGIRVE